MKPFCQYCFNDPVTHLQQKELCGTCERETEVAKRENICPKCEHFIYCGMAVHRDDGKVVMTGCSRFKEKHKQTHYDEIRSMSVEEMAKWLKAYAGCNHFNDKEWCYRNKNCEQCWLEYLKQEAKG